MVPHFEVYPGLNIIYCSLTLCMALLVHCLRRVSFSSKFKSILFLSFSLSWFPSFQFHKNTAWVTVTLRRNQRCGNEPEQCRSIKSQYSRQLDVAVLEKIIISGHSIYTPQTLNIYIYPLSRWLGSGVVDISRPTSPRAARYSIYISNGSWSKV